MKTKKTLMIDSKVAAKFDLICKKQGRTQSFVMTELMREWNARESKKRKSGLDS